MKISLDELEPILEMAKTAAIDYYKLTKKPIGITAEIGEYLVARLLTLELFDARTPGYDAEDADKRKIQIKTRLVQNTKKASGETIGTISFKYPWDVVLLVLLHNEYELFEIYEAEREQLKITLARPGNNNRKRGALTVREFKKSGKLVWVDPNVS